MKKYICVDDYIDRNGAYPASTSTTLKQVCDELKSMPDADVIHVDWLKSWFYDAKDELSFTKLIFDWYDYNSKENA